MTILAIFINIDKIHPEEEHREMSQWNNDFTEESVLIKTVDRDVFSEWGIITQLMNLCQTAANCFNKVVYFYQGS